MDEIQVFQLIAERENERVEFKRLLDLESAPNKAEFIKDVISLANSAEPSGYMLVGIENNGTIVGCGHFEEERIQQILNTYTEPPVQAHCHIVPTSNLMTVGAIEIRGPHKPHKVARSIERLNQNDVFVRHGSVVVKASPEEIIELNRKSQVYADVGQYVRAAAKHAELGNMPSAIKSYTAAIDLAPTYENFLARGNACLVRVKQANRDTAAEEELTTLAAKDFADAIRLSSTKDEEKFARLGRLRLLSELSVAFDGASWQQDSVWLKNNTEGRELGEVLFLEIFAKDRIAGMYDFLADAISALNQAIELKFQEPQVYYLRADAHHYYAHNHGLALQDINSALSLLAESDERQVEYLSVKAHILVRMRRYEEAYEILTHLRSLARGKVAPRYGGFSHDQHIEKEILYRYSLDYKFIQSHNLSVELLRPMFRILVESTLPGNIVLYKRPDGTVGRENANILNMFPAIADVVTSVVGDGFWREHPELLGYDS